MSRLSKIGWVVVQWSGGGFLVGLSISLQLTVWQSIAVGAGLVWVVGITYWLGYRIGGEL